MSYLSCILDLRDCLHSWFKTYFWGRQSHYLSFIFRTTKVRLLQPPLKRQNKQVRRRGLLLGVLHLLQSKLFAKSIQGCSLLQRPVLLRHLKGLLNGTGFKWFLPNSTSKIDQSRCMGSVPGRNKSVHFRKNSFSLTYEAVCTAINVLFNHK